MYNIVLYVFREINIEHTIDECKDFVNKLKSPTNGLEAVPQYLVSNVLSSMQLKETDLIRKRQELKLVWQQAEARILKKTKVQKYKSKAEKVHYWLQF